MPDDYEREHREVLDAAMDIFIDRSHIRGQMWLDWPPSDKIRELKERVGRIESAYARREELYNLPEMEEEYEAKAGIAVSELDLAIESDAIDLINYADFLVKQIRRRMCG
jgi:hypothetical protein